MWENGGTAGRGTEFSLLVENLLLFNLKFEDTDFQQRDRN